MNAQQDEAPSFISCIDTLDDCFAKAASLAHLTRMAHEHLNHECVEEGRLATAETMRLIVEQMDRAQNAKNRAYEIHKESKA